MKSSMLSLAVSCAAGFGLLSCTATTERNTQNTLHSPSGVKSGTYESIIERLNQFTAQNSAQMETLTYGKTRQGTPLNVFKIQDKSVQPKTAKRPAVLISEGIHGDEYLNITDRLPKEFLQNTANNPGFKKFMDLGGVIYLIPVFNPDGYNATQRENANDADLNRDFKIQAAKNNGFNQEETKLATQFIADEVKTQNLKMEVTFEYHCCFGALIIPWNYTKTPMEATMMQKHQDVASKVKDLFGYSAGPVHKILPGYDPTAGGSDDYYLETYSGRSFSFEGMESGGNDFNKHVEMWNHIFTVVANQFDGNSGGNSSGKNFFVAVSTSSDTEKVQLGVSAPATVESLSVCVGSASECAGSAQKISAVLMGLKNSKKIFKLTDFIPMSGNSKQSITIIDGSGKTPSETVSLERVEQ